MGTTMGVPTLCEVTVTLTSVTIAGITTPVGEVLLTATLPEVGGFVEVDLLPLLGVDLTLSVPCPSVAFTASVDLGIVTANLTITAAPVA